MADLEKYKFFGTVLPNGIHSNNSNEVIISVCLNINKYCEDFSTDRTPDEIQTRYNNFYNKLQGLKNYLHELKDFKIQIKTTSESFEVPCYGSDNPFEYFCNESDWQKKKPEFQKIRESLWTQIFPILFSTNERYQVNGESNLSPNDVKQINPLLDKEDLLYLNSFSIFNKNTEAYVIGLKNDNDGKMPEHKIKRLLSKINEFGQTSEKIALQQKIKFISQNTDKEDYKKKVDNLISTLFKADLKEKPISIEEKKKAMSYILSIESDATKNYLTKSKKIDIDEVINSFNAISNEPALMRLMGLIKDFKITLPEIKERQINIGAIIPKSTTEDFLGNYIFSLPTEISILRKNNKVAYLVVNRRDDNKVYFENSILKGETSKLISFDEVSKTIQLIDYSEKILKGEKIKFNENKEALTRGILYTNKQLPEIIQPVSLVNDKGEIVSSLTDEFVTRGHRVAVRINDKSKLYSLTGRSLAFKLKQDKKPFYYCGNAESCVHFDAPIAYLEDGEIKAASSDVLFEYSGELLKLKSAFSKANPIKKATQYENKAVFHHDGGLHKSIGRFEQINEETKTPLDGTVAFLHFPFNEIQKEAWLNCSYSIPSLFNKNFSPKLRFGNNYTFAVYQEYLNGWGLPLYTQKDSVQLSLEEIIEGDSTVFPKELNFKPSENKKTLLLYHRRDVSEDLSKPITEKPSLEHLIVRSDDGEDSISNFDERHILPPKIDLESAFWYDLLSEPNMNAKESFTAKMKANCPFLDEDAYNKFVNEKDEKGKLKSNKCAECGKAYCGGSQMNKFYNKNRINPNFMTDPTVIGFNIRLFWDEACTPEKELKFNDEYKLLFKGQAGIKLQSVLLRALGSAKESFIKNSRNKSVTEICLKKGALIYAQLTNDLNSIGEGYLIEGGWWNQVDFLNKKAEHTQLLDNTTKSKALQKMIIEERNRPKQIQITHAVKEPLFSPKVIKLSSTPNDHKFVEHINDYLKETEYQRYKLGINIIADRIDKSTGNPSINSSFTKIELASHFERLDAIRKIEFLKDILPTGALELWMRKEEFIDNPEQIVLSSKSETNHIPNEPVVSFSNRKNIFNLEHKIEFSNEIMSQLKNLKNIEDIDSISDVFRSLITKLNLEYDFKTTNFEEREYYLKDISKFKGFFTDEKFNDFGDVKSIDKLEEFALPKIKDVMSDLEEASKFRFKVIVLNNSQPPKPDVAFAVTTIQEIRSNPSIHKTISIQKGNIVTIYLKRGRLKSGKDERVGVIVDADSLYNKLFKDNELISKAGRDIVSDRYSNRSKYLQYGDIIIPEINEYKAAFDNELGIYHFLPKFDVEKQLWKFEVELDIKTIDGKQLHNPFINFSLVHFQPFSINYNDKTADASLLDLKNDCRISDVENSTWCYLLPERKLSVFFDKPGLFDTYGEVDLTVSFDHESLHHFNSDVNKWKVRSNFIITVQGSDDELEWQPVGSWLDNGIKTENDFGFHHPLLSIPLLDNEENLVRFKLKFNKWAFPNNTQHSNKYSFFRVRFIEVEWFKNETWEELIKRYEIENPDLLDIDVVNNEEMRIRFVELIY